MTIKTTDPHITFNPRGTGRRTEPLSHVQIPDLWHIGNSIPEIAEMLGVFRKVGVLVDTDLLDEDDPTTEQIDAALEKVSQYYPLINTKGKNTQEQILLAWHQAHDLLNRSRAMATALQPIINLLGWTEESARAPTSLLQIAQAENGTIAVPVKLLHKVREIHTGEVEKKH